MFVSIFLLSGKTQWPVQISSDLRNNEWFQTLPQREKEAGLQVLSQTYKYIDTNDYRLHSVHPTSVRLSASSRWPTQTGNQLVILHIGSQTFIIVQTALQCLHQKCLDLTVWLRWCVLQQQTDCFNSNLFLYDFVSAFRLFQQFFLVALSGTMRDRGFTSELSSWPYRVCSIRMQQCQSSPTTKPKILPVTGSLALARLEWINNCWLHHLFIYIIYNIYTLLFIAYLQGINMQQLHVAWLCSQVSIICGGGFANRNSFITWVLSNRGSNHGFRLGPRQFHTV